MDIESFIYDIQNTSPGQMIALVIILVIVIFLTIIIIKKTHQEECIDIRKYDNKFKNEQF
jgi:energy-converting hydrogenase Eha subunit H